MSKLLSIALAFSFAAPCAPTVAQAAKAKAAQADRCAARPGNFRRQCFIELGATCEPAPANCGSAGHPAGRSRARRDSICASRKSAHKDAAEAVLARPARAIPVAAILVER
jgi:hypothetical protein